jgi:CubicO group peptidase (beta-lactamase class C family)
LAEQGQLDYDMRIADVWPEFAQYGRGDVTLRHALTHSAGVPALPAAITPEDFADRDRMCAIVAGSEPLWRPGVVHGYHAWTFGWLVGEVVRRGTGRTISQVLVEDVAGPLGVRDELFFGVPDAQLDRLARLQDRNWSAALELLSANIRTFDQVVPPGVRTDASLANRRDILRADLLELLAEGADNLTISRILHLAPKTVRNQISTLLDRVGAPDRATAGQAARAAGLGRPGR